MDSTVVQSNVQEYNEPHHPHKVGSQEENQHRHDHEKKSVLKKVKEKARKIKDTIKKHGHHHEHEHDHEYRSEDQHIRHDHDSDEENDEQEVVAKEPGVHGAPIDVSANVESTIAAKPSVNFASTRVMEKERRQEPRVVVVSASTESDQNRATEAEKIVVDQEEKKEQPLVSLERPIGLEEDPHGPGSRSEAYTPSNYETKVTDPTGASAEEVDLTQVQECLARMDVQDEAKASPGSNVLQTGYTSTGSHEQFLTEMSTESKTQYSSATSHVHFLPNSTPTIPSKVSENIEAESKVLTSDAGAQYPSVGSHGQFIPDMHTSSHKTQYPSVGSHDQFNPEPIPINPNIIPENLQAEPEVLPVAVDTHYPPVKSHDQVLPDMSASTKTQYPSGAFSNETPKVMPEATTVNETQNSSIGSYVQFAPEFVPSELQENPQVSGQILSTTTRAVEQPCGDLTEKPSNQNSYAEKISSGASAIADNTASAKNAMAPKLGYDEEGEKGEDENEIRVEEYRSGEKPSNQGPSTKKISSATSAIGGKEVSPENVVASKLGYDEKGDRDESETRQEEYRSEEKPSDQSSYTEKISSAASAIADKAVSAKDVVASKLGYDEKGDRDEKEAKQEEYGSWEKPSNQSSYTEKILSATSAIADKAVSAKNIVASKLGNDEKSDRYEKETKQEEYRSEEKPSNQSSYTEKISSAASAIADKAASAKDDVASKLGYDENETRQEESRSEEKPSNQSSYTEKISTATSTIADKAASAKNVVASRPGYDEEVDKKENEARHEEFKFEEKPLNQSSYPEMISSATSAIADKAVSAKNVIASKLGYGEKGDVNEKETTSEVRESVDTPTVPESSAEYAQKIALSLTEELAPVYGKVGGTESAAISKEPETSLHATDVTTNETVSGAPTQDKGVSVKDYLAEKLRPGDEDMALKEVITDALHKQKEKIAKGTVVDEDRFASEVVADAIHKQEEPKKVEHQQGYEESHVNSPRSSKGVIEKVKDVVGSWFGKPGDSQSSQGESLSKNVDGEEAHVGQRVEEERRLQESTS